MHEPRRDDRLQPSVDARSSASSGSPRRSRDGRPQPGPPAGHRPAARQRGVAARPGTAPTTITERCSSAAGLRGHPGTPHLAHAVAALDTPDNEGAAGAAPTRRPSPVVIEPAPQCRIDALQGEAVAAASSPGTASSPRVYRTEGARIGQAARGRLVLTTGQGARTHSQPVARRRRRLRATPPCCRPPRVSGGCRLRRPSAAEPTPRRRRRRFGLAPRRWCRAASTRAAPRLGPRAPALRAPAARPAPALRPGVGAAPSRDLELAPRR